MAVAHWLLAVLCRFALSGYSAHVAGVYGEVQNLGSLVIRLVFWPIETAAFRAFSVDPAAAAAEDAAQRVALLRALHRFMIVLAAVPLIFGPRYALPAVRMLLAARWSTSEAPALLATYASTLVFLAVNGVMEAYAHARMSSTALMRSSAFLATVAAIHASSIYVARASFGENCHILVMLDAASMALRIAYAYRFVVHLHPGAATHWRLWLPAPASGAVLAAAAGLLQLSENRMWQKLGPQGDLVDVLHSQRLPRAMLVHVGVGAGVLVLLILALLRTERDLVARVRTLLKPHTS